MTKLATGLLLVLTLLAVPATPSLAQHGHSGGHGGFHGGGHGGGWYGGGWYGGGWRGGVFIGGPWWYPWWGPLYPYAYGYPYPYYSPYGYYPPTYDLYAPAAGPSVYMQESAPRSEERVQGYWYYCASAQAYYPTVQKCPEAWIKVPPAPQ